MTSVTSSGNEQSLFHLFAAFKAGLSLSWFGLSWFPGLVLAPCWPLWSRGPHKQIRGRCNLIVMHWCDLCDHVVGESRWIVGVTLRVTWVTPSNLSGCKRIDFCLKFNYFYPVVICFELSWKAPKLIFLKTCWRKLMRSTGQCQRSNHYSARKNTSNYNRCWLAINRNELSEYWMDQGPKSEWMNEWSHQTERVAHLKYVRSQCQRSSDYSAGGINEIDCEVINVRSEVRANRLLNPWCEMWQPEFGAHFQRLKTRSDNRL